MDRDVDVIRVDDTTVKGLRDQILVLVGAGDADGGFPILRQDEGDSRMVGFIGASELEHALSTCILFRCRLWGAEGAGRYRGGRGGQRGAFPAGEAVRVRRGLVVVHLVAHDGRGGPGGGRPVRF